jgi:hypothetical protein
MCNWTTKEEERKKNWKIELAWTKLSKSGGVLEGSIWIIYEECRKKLQ